MVGLSVQAEGRGRSHSNSGEQITFNVISRHTLPSEMAKVMIRFLYAAFARYSS